MQVIIADWHHYITIPITVIVIIIVSIIILIVYSKVIHLYKFGRDTLLELLSTKQSLLSSYTYEYMITNEGNLIVRI